MKPCYQSDGIYPDKELEIRDPRFRVPREECIDARSGEFSSLGRNLGDVTARDIIVIGTSAGGAAALQTLVAGFPPDLQAAIFVVLHIGNYRSRLPEILTRAGPLPALYPSSGDVILKGNIYVAPPDCHLLVELDHMRLSRGPKENCVRPAVDPLFRSAAHAYGSRVTGVILTGGLNDGTAGLAEIKRQGGVAVVQDPRTAFSPSMPNNAITNVGVDYVITLAEIPNLLRNLASGRETYAR
jgi:two-component system chemotaxis response regulator CheB